jgi:hypothetical protein
MRTNSPIGSSRQPSFEWSSGRTRAGMLLERETLDEDQALTVAGIRRDPAPAALARGDVPGNPRAPGMPPAETADATAKAERDEPPARRAPTAAFVYVYTRRWPTCP